jgi:hypothetical protein
MHPLIETRRAELLTLANMPTLITPAPPCLKTKQGSVFAWVSFQ